jgi:hypothetical protein
MTRFKRRHCIECIWSTPRPDREGYTQWDCTHKEVGHVDASTCSKYQDREPDTQVIIFK